MPYPYKIFLDDERFPASSTDDWIICRSTEEFVDVLMIMGLPSFISFDHDLGGEDTGMKAAHEFIDFVIDNEYDLTNFKFYVHSMNPVGAENIRGLMNSFIRARHRNV